MVNDAELLLLIIPGPLDTFFGEVPLQVFCPFLIQLLVFFFWICKDSLYILDMSPFLDICNVNIFCSLYFHSFIGFT